MPPSLRRGAERAVAAAAAAPQVLEPYHSWLLRSTFAFVVKRAPTWSQLLEMLAPDVPADARAAAAQAGMREFVGAGKPLLAALEAVLCELQLEDIRIV